MMTTKYNKSTALLTLNTPTQAEIQRELITEKMIAKTNTIMRKFARKNKHEFMQAQGLMSVDINPLSETFKESVHTLISDVSASIRESVVESVSSFFSLDNMTSVCLKFASMLILGWLGVRGTIKITKFFLNLVSSLIWSDTEFMSAQSAIKLDDDFLGGISGLLSCMIGYMAMPKFDAKSCLDFTQKFSRLHLFTSTSLTTLKDILVRAVNLFRSYILDLPPLFDGETGQKKVD